MKISIAMCTYNGAPYIMGQLDSIARQRRLPDELVICDDGSSDCTVQLASEFAGAVSFPVRVHANASNLGTIRNFERAIGLCTGDVIALADQDDEWLPHKLLSMEAVFESRPRVGLVFSDLEVADELLRPLGYQVWQAVSFSRRERTMVRNGRFAEVMLKRSVVMGTAMAFRAKFRDFVLPIPPSAIYHDYWIAFLIGAVAEIASIDEALVIYRRHASQQSGVGAPLASRSGLGEVFGRSRQARKESYLFLERGYEQLRDTLASKQVKHAGLGRVIPLVEGKIEHLHARRTMPSARWRRIPPVLHELATSRYHRYSFGLRSAAKDFLL